MLECVHDVMFVHVQNQLWVPGSPSAFVGTPLTPSGFADSQVCGGGAGSGGGATTPLMSSGCTNMRSSIWARLAKQALVHTRSLTMEHPCLSQHIGTPVGLGSLDEDTKGVASCSFFDSLFVSASGTGSGTPRLTALGASGGIEALTHPAVSAHSAPASLLQHLPQNVASQVLLGGVVCVCVR